MNYYLSTAQEQILDATKRFSLLKKNNAKELRKFKKIISENLDVCTSLVQNGIISPASPEAAQISFQSAEKRAIQTFHQINILLRIEQILNFGYLDRIAFELPAMKRKFMQLNEF